MKNNKKSFRIASKSLFLTYPQTDLDLYETKEQLESALVNNSLTSFALSKEKHVDGSNHIHVWLKLEKKLNTTNPRLLDLIEDGQVKHGQYENARKDKSSMEYVLKEITSKKDENYLVSEDLKERITDEGSLKSVEETMIALAKQGKVTKALEIFEKERPKEFLNKHIHIRKSLNALGLISMGIAEPKFNLSQFQIDPNIQDLFEFCKNNPTTTLFLVGPPGTGKTQFILTYLREVLHLQPLLINNYDSIKNFDSSHHTCIVFDDCQGLSILSREEVIKILDSEVPTTHRVLHGSKSIDRPTLRVFIMNPPINSVFDFTDEAIKRRVKVFEFEGSLKPKALLG